MTRLENLIRGVKFQEFPLEREKVTNKCKGRKIVCVYVCRGTIDQELALVIIMCGIVDGGGGYP